MKRCQKCFSENDSLMSFCWECGAPLPDLFETTAKTQEFPHQSNPSTPTLLGENSGMKTLEANSFNFVPPPHSTAKTPKSKAYLIIGGIGALLVLGLITVAGIVIYNLIPPKKDIVTIKPTPTAQTKEKTPRPTPDTTFTPPIEPTKLGSFTVQANNGWQLSDILTVPNEEFSTTVQGKIDLAGIKTGVSPNGINDAKSRSRRIYQEFPTGALLMRTRYADGKYSNVVSMTTNGSNGTWLNFPDERGKIEFCVNDNSPENNSGQFIVTAKFTKISVPKK